MAVYENVIVNATEARDAAAQIDTAIKNMQDGIDKLNQEMKQNSMKIGITSIVIKFQQLSMH